jgi:2-polyprenyl-6-methoxyphenol hydroxylase-like FAD-dependent oxidoreductase
MTDRTIIANGEPATRKTGCCIVGGGPAGMMLGVLLARAGIEVIVLEKHGDFLRDFRGDTVHPSTLEILHQLGWLAAFLERPHQELRELAGRIGDDTVTVADFSHLPTACRFIALMPQWDFLDFLAGRGRQYPTFHLQMQAEAVDLVDERDIIAGVKVATPDGPLEIRAGLTIAADGRHSLVRERAGLTVDAFGVPIDVLWMRLSRRADDPQQALGNLRGGHVLVMIDRGDYWQCAFVIAKNGYDELRREGIQSFRETIASIVPFLRQRVDEIRDWDQVKLLTVAIDRLRQWYRPGLLCIGDAAHAMSPIGGVGINLAIQDAVAAANMLAEPLAHGTVPVATLEAVQHRRAFPTRATQRIQIIIQDRVIGRTLRNGAPASLPLIARLLQDHPVLRRLPARMLGLGFRPEHVKTADMFGESRP